MRALAKEAEEQPPCGQQFKAHTPAALIWCWPSPVNMPWARMALQSKPALLVGRPGSTTMLHFSTTTLLLAKHSNTAAVSAERPGLHWAGR